MQMKRSGKLARSFPYYLVVFLVHWSKRTFVLLYHGATGNWLLLIEAFIVSAVQMQLKAAPVALQLAKKPICQEIKHFISWTFINECMDQCCTLPATIGGATGQPWGSSVSAVHITP